MPSRVYRIIKFFEERKSPFSLSRLIMMSGVNPRAYGERSSDDPRDLARIKVAAQSILLPEEQGELEELLEN